MGMDRNSCGDCHYSRPYHDGVKLCGWCESYDESCGEVGTPCNSYKERDEEKEALRSRIKELEEQLNAVCYECYEEKQCDDCKDLTTARKALEKIKRTAELYIPVEHEGFNEMYDTATQALEKMTNETSRSTKKSGHDVKSVTPQVTEVDSQNDTPKVLKNTTKGDEVERNE